jgi:tetratricopeptide (TPR) repeat protein
MKWVVAFAVVVCGPGVLAQGVERERASRVTFNRDVAPIVRDHCVTCHRPEGGAPFSLLTFGQVRARATQIARAVEIRYMPPWKPRAGRDIFADARFLTDTQFDILRRWASEGAPEGDPADRPPAGIAPREWELGPPDLVAEMPQPYTFPADGADTIRTFVIPVPETRSRYVRVVEFRAGTNAVHHANIKIDPSRSARRLDADDAPPGFDGGARDARFPEGHFLGWTPGQRPHASIDDGWLLPSGADLVVELHLTPTGKAEVVQARIGLYFSDRPPVRTPYMLRLGSQRIDIPAGAAAYVSTDRYVLPVDVDVLAVQPHAHHLARSVQGYARRPDGGLEWLIDIPDWDFRWQDVYRYQKPVRLPRGAVLEMKFTYDNSNRNPRNPNQPPRRVTFGQTSLSEMGDLWLQVATPTREDRAALDADYAPKMLNEDIAGDETMLAASPRDARLLSDLASLYLAAGRVEEATVQLERAVRIEPDSAAMHYELGTLLLKQQKLDQAAQEFRRAIALKADLSESHNNLGAIEFLRGDVAGAIDSYREALRHRADNAEARYNLGRALAAANRMGEAIAQYTLALGISADDAETHAGLAAALAIQGDARSAVTHYREALRLDSNLVGALADLAWMLATAADLAVRQPQEAVQLAERAARLTGFKNAVVQDTLAVSYFAAGRPADAIRAAQAALDLASASRDAALANRIAQRLRSYQR